MKRAAALLTRIALECSLVAAWLLYGYEGAGNVTTVYAWLLLFLSPFACTQNAIRVAAEEGLTVIGGAALIVRALLACAIIWHGHIATGVALLAATTMFAVARQEAGILAGARKPSEASGAK